MRFIRFFIFIFYISLIKDAIAKDYEFDASLLNGNYSDTDISIVKNGLISSGTYLFDIVLNEMRIGVDNVSIKSDKNKVNTCFTKDQLSSYGIITDGKTASSKSDCFAIDSIPGASEALLINEQTIRLSIPQVALYKDENNFYKRQWDDGINAGIINYRANQYSYFSNGRKYDSSSVSLSPGVNIGEWRIRSNFSWYKNNQNKGLWQKGNTYMHRGLNDIKSRVFIGEMFTQSDIFDSVGFRGVMLSTDEEMIPYQYREYTPIVKGIANTQAKIEVTQNGRVIYEETVPPGEFALNDLSSVAQRGDLIVRVLESDGSNKEFTVVYQTPAISLREGYSRHNVVVGDVFSNTINSSKESFLQTTLAYGLPLDLTVFSGLQLSKQYDSFSFGMGRSLGWAGAISVDGIFSHNDSKSRGVEQGIAWRMRYSNYLGSGTSLMLTNSQYTTPNYKTLQDAILYNERKDYDLNNVKSKTSIAISQSFREFGSLSLSASYMNMHNSNLKNESYGANYNFNISNASTSIGFRKNKKISQTGKSSNDSSIFASVSIPLRDYFGGGGRFRWQMNSSGSNRTQQEIGLNSDAFGQRLKWDFSNRYQSKSPLKKDSTSTINLGWSGTYGQIGSNYSFGSFGRQFGVNAAGGVVIHSEGITLSQPLSENFALVSTPKVSGVPVNGWPGVKTDFRGFTTANYLSAYRDNLISLDPKGLPSDADILKTDINTAPSLGAITKVVFKTTVGLKALMHISRPNGDVVPFGARVRTETGEINGLVNSDGHVYLSGLPEKGMLTVDWQGGSCLVNYDIKKDNSYLVNKTKEVCY